MSAGRFMQPGIILLREGTDTSQGRGQLLSNIAACRSVVDTVRSTLGPRGMDKLMVDARGNATISNDGATIMKLLEIVHPAARTLVDIARAQDAEVGDGTTSVVVFAGELLNELKPFVEEDVPTQTLIRAIRKAAQLSVQRIQDIAVPVDRTDGAKFREILEKCAATAMNSKLIRNHSDFFKKLVVDAVLMLDEDLNENMIGMKKIPGGGLEETRLIAGVAFKKTFSYAGFEQQPKRFDNPLIISLNIELELKAERDNAEIRIDKVSEYQAIVDAEWKIIYDKLEKIVKTGAKVVLSKLPIGDLATQYFADRDIFCAGRVPEEDLVRVTKAVGGSIQTSVNDLKPEHIGQCALFEEVQIGSERFNLFTGCPKAKTATFLLRGGAEQFIEEVDRSLHDAIMIVRRAIQHKTIVAGGGACEMDISRHLREIARTIPGKQQLLIAAYAKALEAIPRQLCDNAGIDSTDILNKLRQKHAQGGVWYGIDIHNETIADNYETFVWEPALVKINYIKSATEAAVIILSVDETVRSPQAQGNDGPGRGAGRGLPRRR